MILPSIVRSDAMTDSFISERCSLAGRRATSGLKGATLVFSSSRAYGCAPEVPGVLDADADAGPEFVSFQSAMWPPCGMRNVEVTCRQALGPVSPRADKHGQGTVHVVF